MRGRMGLYASGLDYEHREVLLRDKPRAMLDASPKGTVPVFITDDGEVIEESLDLLRWAISKHDPHGWLDTDMGAANMLIEENDGPFKHDLDRYKYASRYKEDAKRGDVDITHRTSAEVFIEKLEDRLSQHPYLMGQSQTLADIAIFPFIRQFANTDKAWWDNTKYIKTREWLERHVTSDLFLEIMKKHPVWSAQA